MNSFWESVKLAIRGLATGGIADAVRIPRPVQQFAASLDGASAFYWKRWPHRRSYRAAQREARSRRNRQLHHGRRS